MQLSNSDNQPNVNQLTAALVPNQPIDILKLPRRPRMILAGIKDYIYTHFRPEPLALSLCRVFSDLFSIYRSECLLNHRGEKIFTLPRFENNRQHSLIALHAHSESSELTPFRATLHYTLESFNRTPAVKNNPYDEVLVLKNAARLWIPGMQSYDVDDQTRVKFSPWNGMLNLHQVPRSDERVQLFSKGIDFIFEHKYYSLLSELENKIGVIYLDEYLQKRSQIGNHSSALVSLFQEWDGIQLRSAILEFGQALHNTHRQLLLENGQLNHEQYNFVVSGNGSSAESRLRWRESFPGFRFLVSDTEIREAIDGGASIVDTLARRYEVSPGLIRRFKGASPKTLENFSPVDVPTTIRILGGCKLSHIPDLAKEDKRIVELQEVIAKTLHVTGDDDEKETVVYNSAKMLANVDGKWPQVSKAANGADPKQVLDFVDAFARRSIYPPLYFYYDKLKVQFFKGDKPKFESTNEFEELVMEWLGAYEGPFQLDEGTRGLLEAGRQDRYNIYKSIARKIVVTAFSKEWHVGQLAKASLNWHRTFGREKASPIRGLYRDWPAICEEQVAPNGCRIVPLTSSAELSLEGEKMHHCVGDYSTFCMHGLCHIFSIRDANDKRLSTLTIHFGGMFGSNVHHLPRHFGYRRQSEYSSRVEDVEIFANLRWDNKEAHADEHLAANWLVSQIRRGGIPVDLEKFEDDLERLEKSRDLVAKIGFDCMDKRSWSKAFSEFEPHLPRGYKTTDPHKFLSQIFTLLAEMPHKDSSLICGAKAVELFMKELAKS